MSALYDQAKAFAAVFPARPASRTSGNWVGLCGVHMVQFGGFLGGATGADMKNQATVARPPWWKVAPGGDISQARLVADKSGPLNMNHAAAPIGAWHFWAVPGVPAGHVGQDLNGGGSAVFMASSSLAEKWSSGGLGINSVTGYTNAKKATYRGWATNYSGGQVFLPAETPLAGNQRRAGAKGVFARSQPTTQSTQSAGFAANAIATLSGWAHGERQSDGNDVWFTEGTKWYWSGGFTDTGTHDLKDLNPHTVTFDAKGGKPVPASQVVAVGAKAIKPVDPAQDGKVFDGWLNGDALWDFNQVVTTNLSLAAKWSDVPVGDCPSIPEIVAGLAPQFKALEDVIAELSAKLSEAISKIPTAEEIGEEVIRQLKLPGN